MRTGVLAAAVAGLVIASLFIVVAGRGIIASQEQLAAAQPEAGGSAPEQTQSSTARPSPQPPAESPQELQRVEPRAPLSPIAAPEDPATRPPRPTLLHRPVVTAAGQVEAEGHRIALEGIEPLASDEMCDTGGTNWPCGIHARTAFRSFLRGRAIECTVSGTPVDEVVVSKCEVGASDPALWLVQQGWARAAPGSDYGDAQDQAEEAGRGMFGRSPRP